MSKTNEITVKAILPAINEVGQPETKEVVEGISELNTQEKFRNAIRESHSDFLLKKRSEQSIAGLMIALLI